MDAVQSYIEHIDFKDEPFVDTKIKGNSMTIWNFNNIYSSDQKENFDLLREFRIFLDEITSHQEGCEK